ncbi:unnamed protein product [Didymodactylos carnosus]|uniref:Cyclin B n=1 Tax=Didymodactylos carnosus TaxID=1234261 RepID=A0A814WR01_9BILA|nr:unnamed protein product [Didymodactylos carnosus]CAF1205080.1 unnamed protein product [Didymodactylos carnosus]CAF3726249.1 unnamed protein product [Didymodactylos carnosus]CAF3969381.1 unnamed protein product [Didymodactylos carnosus]
MHHPTKNCSSSYTHTHQSIRMHHHVFFRPQKTNVSSSSSLLSETSNDENNSTIKSLIFKPLEKQQHSKVTMKERGILGEVGNRTTSTTTITNKLTTLSINKKPPPTSLSKENLSTKNVTRVVVVEEEIEQKEEVQQIEQNNLPQQNETQEILIETTKVTDVPQEFDCDSSDSKILDTVYEYIYDICKYWRELEQKMPITPNYLQHRKGTVTANNRAILIDWLYQVHDRFKLLSDTFYTTVQIIDRYLQAVDVQKRDLQLIGSTALFMACKYEEMRIPEMNDLVYVSDNAFSKDDMKEMERDIFDQLNYDLGRPLAINFLRRYSKIGQASDIEHTLGKYLLELTFTDISLVHYSPSYLAACAAFLARYLILLQQQQQKKGITITPQIIKKLTEHIWPTDFFTYHTSYSFEQLKSGIEQLGQLLIQNESGSNKLKSVKRKYSQPCLFSIATNDCCKLVYVQLALNRLFKQ